MAVLGYERPNGGGGGGRGESRIAGWEGGMVKAQIDLRETTLGSITIK